MNVSAETYKEMSSRICGTAYMLWYDLWCTLRTVVEACNHGTEYLSFSGTNIAIFFPNIYIAFKFPYIRINNHTLYSTSTTTGGSIYKSWLSHWSNTRPNSKRISFATVSTVQNTLIRPQCRFQPVLEIFHLFPPSIAPNPAHHFQHPLGCRNSKVHIRYRTWCRKWMHRSCLIQCYRRS